jgi:acyl-homoserine-lactone acylase
LPKVLDPEGGFVQNSNSPPWYAASPLALDPASYPPYMSPQYLHWRERHGIRLLAENADLTLDRLVEFQHSTRMELADAILDDLLTAVAQTGDTDAKNAAAVLANWDRQAQATSTGTLLFIFWVQAMESPDLERSYGLFRTPWNPNDPLTMPTGIADPQKAVLALSAAAGRMQTLFGRLDRPWGDIARVQRGKFDLPANGCDGDPYGTIRVLFLDYSNLESKKQILVSGGDSYVAGVEFGNEVKARVLMTYGNASQPGSPHLGDQLVLSSRGEMRTPWRTRAEIEANLEEHEVLA